MLLTGYFNSDLVQTEGERREEEISAALKAVGLEDMYAQFLPRWIPWCRDRRMWSMVRAVREVRSQTDYILGTDRCLFWNVSVRGPRHNLGHYLVRGCL